MKINREDLEQILIDNFTGKDGHLDLSDLDFRKVKGKVILTRMKAKVINNSFQEAVGITNAHQVAKKIINSSQDADEIDNTWQEANYIKSVKSI